MSAETGQAQQGSRARVIFAAGAAAALALIVGIVLLAGGGEESGIDPPPEECLAAWNDDDIALSDGVHAYNAHSYGATEVVHVDERGRPLPGGAAGGDCAVIFGASELDFEPEFSARVHADGRWAPLLLERQVPIAEIEKLQQGALDNANATLLPDGTLVVREG